MPVARRVRTALERASWIRKMFEEGARLKQEFGPENVFDFSLGNPNLDPPERFREVLKELVENDPPGCHGYMPNAGFPDVRAAVAAYVSTEQGVELSADHIIMTVGAGGALNTVFRAILDPGDEVVVPRPYFVEYNFYLENHGCTLTTVPTTETFDLRLDALDGAIGPKTRAVLINSPNNPTGKVYDRASLEALRDLLDRKSAELGRRIYLISDEPYRKIVYDGVEVPPVLEIFPHAFVCTSYSKDLSLPGERIGYVAVSPRMDDVGLVVGALTFTNRVLGYVNAPALMQRAVARLQGVTVDLGFYRRNRDALYQGLVDAGYECPKPEGAFYLFPKSPIPDDVAFVKELQKENILAVPGSGFGGPGHFRLAYCCAYETVERSLPGFRRALERVKA
ncbi:MAG: pyridoxal phosphate-dependent aminotransferase [Candidatus Dadabacteria bacterium]|nr:MAG: pyridoxal phosphate-dependent aminotransferase [Candidatus Dadabacteria bacterium]